MKKVIAYLLCLIALSACKNDNGDLGEPASKLEGINDSFKLVEVWQVDLQQTADNMRDVSSVMVKQNPSEITFNSQDFTYQLVTGDSPNYLNTASGIWAFDDNEYPSVINMQTDEGEELTLDLAATIRPSDALLQLQLSKVCGAIPSIGYLYKFERQ